MPLHVANPVFFQLARTARDLSLRIPRHLCVRLREAGSSRRPADPTIIMLHHNPDPSLSGFTDSTAFLEIVRAHRQVKALIDGHTHEFRLSTSEGVHLINLPATGYRFNPDEPLGWAEAHIHPSGAAIDLHCLHGRSRKFGTRHHLAWRRDRRT